MGNEPQPDCPVCGIRVSASQGRFETGSCLYDCPNCGKYEITEEALSRVRRLYPDDKARAVLSHEIWKMQDDKKIPRIFSTHTDLAEKETLPDPAEQQDNLIYFLGTHQESLGSHVTIPANCLRAKLGAKRTDEEYFIVASAVKLGIVDNLLSGTQIPSNVAVHGLRLTMKGWQRFREITRGKASSRTAFMAMPFGNAEVRAIVDDVFRVAVEETGFHLKRLDDETPAGSIDDRLRVEIRMCRFLIADLTCNNSGAYWEAGYAEGLGKHVIYTCNKFYFDKEGTHFDTNHHQTVLWDPADPIKAAEDLKNTIRATLPDEAKMPKD